MKGIEDLPDNYKEFMRMRRRVLPPMTAPTSLPSLPADTEPGTWIKVQSYLSMVISLQNDQSSQFLGCSPVSAIFEK